MSYSENNTIFNYNSEDSNFLSTKRDEKTLQQWTTTFQFEPGIVLDVILNDSHPLFKSGYMGKITSVAEFPLNYKNIKPSETDFDYRPVGSVLVRLCYSHQKVDKENLIWATPLDNSFSSVPLLNEVVSVIKYFDGYYYTNKINSKNGCNSSADFRYEQTYGKKPGNRSYLNVELSGPTSKLNSEKKSTDDSSFSGVLGEYFWFNNKIRNLRRFEGDTILESRFGQSIRFGAYDDNRFNDCGGHDNYKSGTTDFGGGNPMILIRNRQRPLAQDVEQRLHPQLNPISTVSDSPNEKNVSGYMMEDINNDGSSIHVTSGLTVSKFKSTCYKTVFSRDIQEEQPAFRPKNSTQFSFPKLNNDQIVINSDRLIFSSRFGETFHFSKKRYSIITDGEYTVDSHDQMVFTTNTKTVINSPAIYLGEYNNTNEPVLLGQTTVNLLYDLCNWLASHSHWYKHSHSIPGTNGPSPEQTQLPVEIKELFQIRDRLHTLMSRRVFVVGGGFAPGFDGGSITDGILPVKIDTLSGNGVPGTWMGKNKR